MKLLIEYFFYKIYSFSLSNGENSPSWAVTTVSIFGIINLYTLTDIFLIVFNKKMFIINEIFIIFIGLLIIYFYYSFLVRNGNLKLITNKFKGKGNLKLNLSLIAYIIISLVLFISTGILVRSIK